MALRYEERGYGGAPSAVSGLGARSVDLRGSVLAARPGSRVPDLGVWPIGSASGPIVGKLTVAST